MNGWQWFGLMYFCSSCYWLGIFIRKGAFNLKRIGPWIGAILAVCLWPIGVCIMLW